MGARDGAAAFAAGNDDGQGQKVLLGYVLALVVGMLGGLVGGYGGYAYRMGYVEAGELEGAGLLPVLTAAGGFIIFFTVALFTVGPSDHLTSKLSALVRQPALDRAKVVGFSSFELFITVHRVKNLFNADPCTGFFGAKCNPYVEVLVGRTVDDRGKFSVQRNPAKRTCVSTSSSFEESFRFVVSPTDDTIRFVLWDQDLVDDDVVGMCDLNITEDVLKMGFPQKKSYKLARGDALDDAKPRSGFKDADHHAGSLVASFAPGEDFPAAAAASLQATSRREIDRLRSAKDELRSQAAATAGPYGTMVTGATRNLQRA
mmetsp:Transcript_643/g.2026  ORF Transcript_643/g.2026 Transcript_643/m.2026 type:complete len:316 (-) Transcript_643:49-996(-)